jgi:hypothetical protein
MKGIDEEIYKTGLFFYFEYLQHYGVDRYNTKKSLLILSCIDELLDNNCYYDIIDENSLSNINRFYNYILSKNPQLKYCRKCNLNYNNLGNAQNIQKFQMIDMVVERFKNEKESPTDNTAKEPIVVKPTVVPDYNLQPKMQVNNSPTIVKETVNQSYKPVISKAKIKTKIKPVAKTSPVLNTNTTVSSERVVKKRPCGCKKG